MSKLWAEDRTMWGVTLWRILTYSRTTILPIHPEMTVILQIQKGYHVNKHTLKYTPSK